MKKIIINDENLNFINQRIDKVLSNIEINNFSRSKIDEFFKSGIVFVNKKSVKSSYKLKKNDIIEYNFEIKEEKINIESLNIDIPVIYEDDQLAVLDKPKGLVVHPGNGHRGDTLVNIIKNKYESLSDTNGPLRPGIVHRIDKDTSGLLVIAKTNKAHEFLAEQLKDHTMHREYYAIVKGVIKENQGKIIAPIARDKKNRLKMAVDTRNGKDAITFFNVMQRYKNYTLIKLKLLTGRTHQIRVHMSYIGFPIEGDELYYKNTLKLNGQLLHAYKITFVHPITKKEMSFETKMPDYFTQFLEKLQ